MRQRDGRAAGCVDDGARVERVLVHAHDRLLVERRGPAEMIERVDRAAVRLNDVVEAAVGLRADVGLGGYGFEHCLPLWLARSRDKPHNSGRTSGQAVR